MRKVEAKFVVGLLGTVIMAVAGFGFTYKFVEFFRSLLKGEIQGFAMMPVITYIIVGLGFLLLLVWSIVSGQLKDIEGPKYRMLEQEEEYERQEKEREYERWLKEGFKDI